jgi:hypothetical protein
VRLPEGRRLSRRFESEAPLQALVDWVESEDPEIYEFDLVSSYPKKELTREQRGSTLAQLGLQGSIMLFTREQ